MYEIPRTLKQNHLDQLNMFAFCSIGVGTVSGIRDQYLLELRLHEDEDYKKEIKELYENVLKPRYRELNGGKELDRPIL